MLSYGGRYSPPRLLCGARRFSTVDVQNSNGGLTPYQLHRVLLTYFGKTDAFDNFNDYISVFI